MDLWFKNNLKKILGEDKNTIGLAHTKIIKKYYKLIGFHGCGSLDANAIVPDKFDPEKAGQQALGRGMGFYVAGSHGEIVKSFAAILAYNKNRGKPMVLRVYAKKFDFLRRGRDYDWGIMDGLNIGELTYEKFQEEIDKLFTDMDFIEETGKYAQHARQYNVMRRKARAKELIESIKKILDTPTDYKNEIEIEMGSSPLLTCLNGDDSKGVKSAFDFFN